MADDDIERLLREVDALESGGAKQAQPPAKRSAEPAPSEDSGGGMSRTRWAALSAAGGGVGGFIVGSVLFFLPWIDGPSTAIGAAAGAAVTGLVSGPPNRFQKSRTES